MSGGYKFFIFPPLSKGSFTHMNIEFHYLKIVLSIWRKKLLFENLNFLITSDIVCLLVMIMNYIDDYFY